LVTIKAERLSAPEKHRKGAFSMKGSVKVDFPDDDFDSITFKVFLELNGFNKPKKASDSTDVVREKTISISLHGEALFTFSSGGNDKTTKGRLNQAEIIELNKQVHPLLMSKARALAGDMGFGVIKPDLGFDDAIAVVPLNKKPTSNKLAPKGRSRLVKAPLK